MLTKGLKSVGTGDAKPFSETGQLRIGLFRPDLDRMARSKPQDRYHLKGTTQDVARRLESLDLESDDNHLKCVYALRLAHYLESVFASRAPLHFFSP